MIAFAERITTFALEAYLHQLQQDGYSVFVVRGGDLPVPARQPGEGSRDCWYRVKELLESSRGGDICLSSPPAHLHAFVARSFGVVLSPMS